MSAGPMSGFAGLAAYFTCQYLFNRQAYQSNAICLVRASYIGEVFWTSIAAGQPRLFVVRK